MATVIASPAEAAERFAAYAAADAESICISPGIGSVGKRWMRQCELVAEARAMLTWWNSQPPGACTTNENDR